MTKNIEQWPPAGVNWYYSNNWTAIACADYRDVIAKLPKTDLVLTDPPFNAGKSFQNDSLSTQQWSAFCVEFTQYMIVLAPPNLLVEVSKKDNIMRRALEEQFPYRYALCLNYTNSMRNGTVGFHNWGLVLWFGTGRCHKRYMDRIDSALHSTKKEFSHPSPKEVTHYKKLTEMFCPPGGLVVDPFCGSGTTLIGAKELHRRCIGIEIEEKYCEIAALRCIQEEVRLEKLEQAKGDTKW